MFKSEIVKTGKELTSVKEKVIMKDTLNAIRLDEATQSGSVDIYPDNYGVLKITNDHSEDGEYIQYIIIDKSGQKYLTGSESFFSAFMTIYEEMVDSGEEFGIRVYRIPSKNYKGKDFISCSVI